MDTHDYPPDFEGELVTVRPEQAIATVQSLPYFVGLSGKTANTTGLSMHLVVIPPGAIASPHYHQHYETGIYVLEGAVETRYGQHLDKVSVNQAGDFLYIPPGVPHTAQNLSATTAAKAIVARNDAHEQENVVPYTIVDVAAEG
ncbi:MAG: cupin domain-containing protein [Leptolyngbya sp. SIOISBB]|nr:cupin domain-containing protein [Leptolyngbya sp. SIOISBB]